ncbi:MAG TPA: IclR family transcriptional regulator, partial [Chondromyces sp.]|nr:IclR family transcriptional regulator [Chondromyces sp.]
TIVTSTLEVNRESHPILQRLVQEVNETAHIGMLEGTNVIYLSRVECKHPVQILSHVGRRNPLHCTSSGKVLLAYQAEEFIKQYIDEGLPSYTAHTITDPDGLRQALESVREQEYAVSVEEINEGVASIAAPVRDYTGKVMYAVSVIGPIHRMDPHDRSLIHQVKHAAKEISESLGYRGTPF